MGSLVQGGIAIGANPADTQVNVGDEAAFLVIALGPDIVYQWKRNGIALSDGVTPHGSIISGSSTSTLIITNVQPEDFGGYSVAVTNACGQAESRTAALARTCRADVNDDGVLNSQDFFDFLTPFFASDPSADYNNDGSVNSQDFFDFLTDFFAGC